jgi:hydroxyquinol 1,2-dioxygenase
VTVIQNWATRYRDPRTSRYCGPSEVEPIAAKTTPSDITSAAIASFDGCADARLRQLMQTFVAHLHAFAVEVSLTEEEWRALIGTLTDTGHITDDRRQEFILWSDTLGLSMLVDALAHELPPGATESTVLGPFYVPDSPRRGYGESMEVEPGAGVPAWVHGRVLDLSGAPIAGAELDVWQNGADMLYAVQRPDAPEDHLRGRYLTREDGSFAFVAVRPVPYPIPDDGPVGRMLAATRRHAWRPAHLHIIARAPGYRTVTTHIFDAASEHLDSDTVFAVKPSLVRTFAERSADDPDRPPGITGEWVSLETDIVLTAGEGPDEIIDPGRTA